MNKTVDPSAIVDLKISAQEVGIVLEALREMPYRVSAGAIARIELQAKEQLLQEK